MIAKCLFTAACTVAGLASAAATNTTSTSSTSTSTTSSIATSTALVVNQTVCNGQTYTYQQLAGFGWLASNARDKYGDTIGGIGSAIAFNRSSWTKTSLGYTGVMYAIPDRGW